MKALPPKLCFTVSGCLIVKGKILLVKHRKASMWLKPGGHLEEHELPHEAAVREFQEETGIKVRIKKFGFLPDIETADSKFIPQPFAMNTHWVSRENYKQRLASDKPHQRVSGNLWQRGCEKHIHMSFLLEPATTSLGHHLDTKELTGIGWYSLEEVERLDTTEDIKSEIQYAFKLLEK